MTFIKNYRGALLILLGLILSLLLESSMGLRNAQLVFIVFMVLGFSISLLDRRKR